MFTSRAEYRLLLRQDNADRRLTSLAYEQGLASRERYERVTSKEESIGKVKAILGQQRADGESLEKMLRRPKTSWAEVVARHPPLEQVEREIARQVEYDVKYAPYVERQTAEVARQKRLAKKEIPEDFDYASIGSLRNEAKEKLAMLRPGSLAQAGRISGITPADVALLMVHLGGRKA